MKKFEQAINQTKNDKHRFILKLLYQMKLSTGIIINQKVKDIRDNILYCRGKRLYIPDSLMHEVYKFTHEKDPDDYLVESEWKKQKQKYSISSIQQIRKQFLKRLKKA